MKKIAIVIVLAFVILGLSVPNNSSKIGFIDVDEITKFMPEMMEINQQVNNFSAIKNQKLVDQSEVYGKKYQEFESNKQGLSEKEIADKNTELNTLASNIEKLSTKIKNEISAERKSLSKKLIEKVNLSIDEYAKNKGFTAIFDIKNKSILYSNKENDLTEVIKNIVIK